MKGKVDNFLKYYNVSVHPERVCVTPRFEGLHTSHRPIISGSEIEENESCKVDRKVVFMKDNKLSRITKSKINKAVSYLNYIANDKVFIDRYTGNMVKYKLTFATLTLSSSQIHTDNEIKHQLVNQFFVEIRKKYSVSHYVWRGEKQLNGNLHIHIVLDKWLPWQELQDIWNRIQNKLGYVDRYKDKMSNLSYREYCELFKNNKRYSQEKIKKAWIKGRATNWMHPNSTDIHSLQFINDITAYICKYMKKDEQNNDLEGRLWSASHSLSNLSGGRDIVSNDIGEEIGKLSNSKEVRKVSDTYFDLFYVNADKLQELGCELLFEMFEKFLSEQFGSSALRSNSR